MSWYVLSGDIGGTNSRLVLSRVTKDGLALPEKEYSNSHEVVHQHTYKNAGFDTFTTVLEHFVDECATALGEASVVITTGCLAVAGPVSGGCVHFTNIDWVINASELALTLGITELVLVNDFVANG